jgi:apolipoprotein N-acyltransferase
LVPFGEFLPFESFLNKIGLKAITNNFGSFSRGEKRKIIKMEKNFENLSFLPLICYEIIYSGKLSTNFDFDYIFNISEDGWFGKSVGPKQHLVHSVYRAIESGKYVIRSSNNGVGVIINPLGEIENKIDYGKDGFIDFNKRRDIEQTVFSKYGNKIFFILILLYIFLIFSFNRFKNE